MRDIARVCHEQFTAACRCAVECVCALRDNGFPFGFLRFIGINHHDALVRCIVIGGKEQFAAHIVNQAPRIVKRFDDRLECGLLFLQVANPKSIAFLTGAAVRNIQDEKPLVVGNGEGMKP